MIRNILLFFSILVSLAATAQRMQNVRITHYTQEDGLPNELTKSISQDSLGFVWIATDAGLARFDGFTFTQYVEQLPSNYVKSLLCTKKGQLLVTTDMGFLEIKSSIDKVEFKMLMLGSTSQTDTTMWFPKQLYEDAEGIVWLSDNNTVYRYDGNTIKRYKFSKKDESGNFHRSFSFADDGNGHLFAFSEPGNFYRYNRQTDKFDEVPNKNDFSILQQAFSPQAGVILLGTRQGLIETTFDTEGNLLSERIIDTDIDASAFCKTANGQIYMGTWTKGLFLFDAKNGTYQYKKIKHFQSNAANNLFYKDGRVWAASDYGAMIVEQSFYVPVMPDKAKGYIQDVDQADDGTIWFTDGKSLIALTDAQTFIVDELTNNNFLQILPTNDGVWVSDQQGFLYFYKNKKKTKTIDVTSTGKAIYNIANDNEGNIWLCQDQNNGLTKVSPNGKITTYGADKGMVVNPVMVKHAKNSDLFIGGGTDTAFLFRYNPTTDRIQNMSVQNDFGIDNQLFTNDILIISNTEIWLATSQGIVIYNNGTLKRMDLGNITSDGIKSLLLDQNNTLWFSNSLGWNKLQNNSIITFDEYSGLPSKTISYRATLMDKQNRLWVGTLDGLCMSYNDRVPNKTPQTLLLSVEANGIKLQSYNRQQTFNNKTYLQFSYICPSYPGKFIQYQARLLGKDTIWTTVGKQYNLLLSELKNGAYTLQIRALQKENYLWSKPIEFSFRVSTIWYQTWWAWTLVVLFFATSIYIAVKWNTRRLEKEKQRLEKLVIIRTQEIEKQRKEIEKQRDEVTQHRDKISEQNKKITDSINYARRIQSAVLTAPEMIKQLLPEHVLLYRPRDIVSGDFYWIQQITNKIVVVAADCTGHGVPGAFMSMLGASLLNEIVGKKGIISPDHILEEMRKEIKTVLKQTGSKNESRDGMDMAICVIMPEEKTIRYAGAFIPLYYVRQGKLKEIEPTRNPVAFYRREEPFTYTDIPYNENDMFYMFSDGLADQTNVQNIKYSRARVKMLLTSIADESVEEQNVNIEEELNQWINKSDQLDDIMLIGFRAIFNLQHERTKVDWRSFTILVADDDELSYINIENVLAETGIQLVWVKNGKEAVEYCKQNKNIDVVLIDIEMPIMDGLKATVHIKENSPSLPVIVQTAAKGIEKTLAFDAGCDNFISKPINERELLATISKYLSDWHI